MTLTATHRSTFIAALAAASIGGTGCKGTEASWQPGAEYVYDASLTSSVAEATAPVPLFDLTVKGKLHVVPRAGHDDSQPLTLWMKDAEVTSAHGADQQAQIAALTAELERPTGVVLERGLITGYDITAQRSVIAVSVIRTFASALQLGPAPEGKTTFETQEYDSTGRYVARNERKQPDQVHKAKLRYDVVLSRMQSAQGQPVQAKPVVPTVEQSAIDVKLQHGVPASVTMSEHVRAPLLTNSSLNSFTTLKLALSSKKDGSAAPEVVGERVHLAAGDTYLPAPKIDDLDGARIGDRTFESVLKELEAFAAESDPAALAERAKETASDAEKEEDADRTLQRNRTFSALTALIRQRPETVDSAVAKIRAGSPAARWLASGLASSGSAAAQEGMVTLINDTTLDRSMRKAIAVSLLQANEPTVASARAVEALIADPSWRQFATYGLGTLARRLRDVGETEESARLVQELTRRLTSAKDVQETKDVLAGLANAAAIDALPSVKPFLGHPEASVRENAVLALRLLEDPQVDGLIIARLSEDEASTVRVTAIQSAARRETASEPLARAVSRAATDDADVQVRVAAIRALAKWLRGQPTLRGVIEGVAAKDKDPNVQIVAKAALAAKPG